MCLRSRSSQELPALAAPMRLCRPFWGVFLCAGVQDHTSKLQTFEAELAGKAKPLESPYVRIIPAGLGS